ncbi:MAG TPA: hypothetical protein VGP47_09000, partial [Parachlamydiaceae bacterium]|nr:hypothetical protein [Parachlamydiaceae bacterium]
EEILIANPKAIEEFANIYLKAMSEGPTSQAAAADKAFRKILNTPKMESEYVKIAQQALQMGGVKGRKLAEDLFELALKTNPTEAIKIFEFFCLSNNSSPPIILKMADDFVSQLGFNDKEIMEGAAVNEIKHLAVFINEAVNNFIAKNSRAEYVKPLLEWLIHYTPRIAHEQILKDIQLNTPFFTDYLDTFLENLRLRDPDLAFSLTMSLFNNPNPKIKAEGSGLFHRLITENGLPLLTIYPKSSSEQLVHFLTPLKSDNDPFVQAIKPQIDNMIEELNLEIDQQVVEKENEDIGHGELTEQEFFAFAQPDMDADALLTYLPFEALEYVTPTVIANGPSIREELSASDLLLNNYSQTISQIRADIKNDYMQVLKGINSLIQDASLKTKYDAKILLNELADAQGANFGSTKEILRYCMGLSEDYNDLKLEVASHLAKANLNQVEKAYQFLVLNYDTKDLKAALLFFEGLACIDFPRSKAYLLSLRSKGIEIKSILSIIQKAFPQESNDLASEWKTLKDLSLHGLADDFLTSPDNAIPSSPISHSFTDQFLGLSEQIRQGVANGSTRTDSTALLQQNPLLYFTSLKALLREIPDEQDAIKIADFFFSITVDNIQNTKVLQLIKNETGINSFVGDILNDLLHKNFQKVADEIADKVDDSRIMLGDEHSRLQKFVLPIMDSTKLYLDNFPYHILKAIDSNQKFQTLTSFQKQYMREAFCSHILEQEGPNNVFSLLHEGIRDEYFDRNPPLTTYATLATFQELLLKKNPEMFPELTLNYLYQMDQNSPERAAAAKVDLNKLLERAAAAKADLNKLLGNSALKPFSFKIANSAVNARENGHLSVATQRFIEGQLNEFIKAGQIHTALEIFKSYAHLTPELNTLRETVEKISALPLSKAQRVELSEIFSNILKNFINHGTRESLLTPSMDWLIDNNLQGAFNLLTEELNYGNPGFEKELPYLARRIAENDPLMAQSLFMQIISHPKMQIKAAGADLVEIVTSSPDPEFPVFLLNPDEGVLAHKFQLLEEKIKMFDMKAQLLL